MIPKLDENIISGHTDSVTDICTNSGLGEPGSNCSVVFPFAQNILEKDMSLGLLISSMS